MFTTKRSLSAALLGSVALFLILAFLPSKVVQGRSAPPQQAVDPHLHATPPSNMIDGSVHPEMIQEKNRQRAILAPTHLNETELASAGNILQEFKIQYEAAIQRYNTSAEAALASNSIPDITPFLLERDAIVQSAKQRLEGAVSPQSMARFHAYVQGEKSKMKVAMEGGVQ